MRVHAPGRVVSCDSDPIVLTHAAALLCSTPEGVTEYLQADVRDPAAIVEGARRVLDFDRPVAPRADGTARGGAVRRDLEETAG
ncbi:hypothetical protein GCM10010121_041680 [Streptomyces brasiliensis]|uniref:Uncharacterized protein n=1 Tax=Streptomyces brasiliensis TaxID=1954 RepID=A0A917KRQ3_9ACTN|nr:hypothetical protein GCM10010121_041680 [Streptomyces brasiliensis]